VVSTRASASFYLQCVLSVRLDLFDTLKVLLRVMFADVCFTPTRFKPSLIRDSVQQAIHKTAQTCRTHHGTGGCDMQTLDPADQLFGIAVAHVRPHSASVAARQL
jgi:hypothetical protein